MKQLEPKPVSRAQLLYAKKIAQGRGLIISDEAKASSAAMSAGIDANRDSKRRRRGRKTAYKPAGQLRFNQRGRQEVSETQS